MYIVQAIANCVQWLGQKLSSISNIFITSDSTTITCDNTIITCDNNN